jgi:hypothetical protein
VKKWMVVGLSAVCFASLLSSLCQGYISTIRPTLPCMHAFVGVLWPMFGPLPAPGLVELVAELRMMPDGEVRTYLHQEWPVLVEAIDHQPPGIRTIVVGYSLGANS